MLAYLRSQGYGKDEAAALLEELVSERAATVRGKGIMNIVGGSVLPDDGTMRFAESVYAPRSPGDATARGTTVTIVLPPERVLT